MGERLILPQAHIFHLCVEVLMGYFVKKLSEA